MIGFPFDFACLVRRTLSTRGSTKECEMFRTFGSNDDSGNLDDAFALARGDAGQSRLRRWQINSSNASLVYGIGAAGAPVHVPVWIPVCALLETYGEPGISTRFTCRPSSPFCRMRDGR